MTAFAEACRALAGVSSSRARIRGRSLGTLANPYELTSREMEVARLLTEGLSNKEMAARLYLTESSVKFHITHLMEKMDCCNRVQVAVKWVREQEYGGQ